MAGKLCPYHKRLNGKKQVYYPILCNHVSDVECVRCGWNPDEEVTRKAMLRAGKVTITEDGIRVLKLRRAHD